MKLHANNTEKKEVINTNDLLDCIKTRAQITNIEIIVKSCMINSYYKKREKINTPQKGKRETILVGHIKLK